MLTRQHTSVDIGEMQMGATTEDLPGGVKDRNEGPRYHDDDTTSTSSEESDDDQVGDLKFVPQKRVTHVSRGFTRNAHLFAEKQRSRTQMVLPQPHQDLGIFQQPGFRSISLPKPSELNKYHESSNADDSSNAASASKGESMDSTENVQQPKRIAETKPVDLEKNVDSNPSRKVSIQVYPKHKTLLNDDLLPRSLNPRHYEAIVSVSQFRRKSDFEASKSGMTEMLKEKVDNENSGETSKKQVESNEHDIQKREKYDNPSIFQRFYRFLGRQHCATPSPMRYSEMNKPGPTKIS